LQLPAVQTFVTKRITEYLSKELNASITIGGVYLKPFSSLKLTQVEWKDNKGKIVLSANTLESNFVLTQLINNKLEIEEIILDKGYVNFEIFKDSTNLSDAIAYFSPAQKKKNKKNSKLKLNLKRIELKDNSFSVIDHTEKHYNQGIDFTDLSLTNVSATFDNIKLDSIIKVEISDLQLTEKSGFTIKKLDTKLSYGATYMEFDDLFVATNKSTLQNYLKLEYDSLNDFIDFIDKVQVTANVSSSSISSYDIEYFAPSMKTVIFDTKIKNAKLKGTVANINARDVSLNTAKQTSLKGDFTIKGLPLIDKTIFNFNLKELNTNASDIEYLVPRLSNQKSFQLPSQLNTLGEVSFAGTFIGLYNNFKVDGKFNTDLGQINTTTDIQIKSPLIYSGNIKSDDFVVSEFIQNNTVQKTGFDLDFNGSGLNIDQLALDFDGHFKNAEFLDYNYERLNLRGNIVDKQLNLIGNTIDENLDLLFDSSIDWKGVTPTYSLDAKINYAALNNLKWINKDSIVIQDASIKTNLIGNTLNTLVGHFYADSINMSTSKGNFQINNIDFVASGDEQSRLLTLESDILEARVQGNIDLNTITAYFKSLAMRYAPASAIETPPYNPQNFNLELHIKSFKPIAALIDPDLSLDNGSYLNATFSSDNYTANFTAYSPIVIYKNLKITNLGVIEVADDKAFTLNIMADRLNFSDSTYINKINITNVLANDSLRFNIEMSEQSATNYLNLNGNIHFAHNAPAYIKFQPSSIIINKEKWHLNNDALLRVSKGKIYINKLQIDQEHQQVILDGIVSNEDDQLNILFNRFSLTSLNGITKPLGINLRGTLNGSVQLHSILKNPYATAKLQTTPIIYNQLPIGQLELGANYDPQTKLAELDINLFDEIKRGITLKGHYSFEDSKEPINLKGTLKQVDLSIFQPFLRNLVSNLQGRSDADISIVGSFKNPKISGLGRFHHAEFTVNYLKTSYKVDNQIALVDNNNIIIQNFSFGDFKEHKAIANGYINLEKLATPYIDLNIAADNFMVLNTNLKDNNIYYGTAYATGNFKFKGFTSSLNIDINAKSESGTVINIPFNSAMTVSDSDFIYFVGKDSTENLKREKKASFNGITMNMGLNLTPDAEVNLKTNLGSLRGNGSGTITMKISSLGDFEMFGDYIVNNGKFHFTAQDFINKYFDIQQGGTIRWTGSPSEAIINLNAIYQQRTAIRPLYNAAGRDGEDERVLAQADMNIKGTLEQPDISFDLNFPQNPYIKDQLQSFLSDANNVNQQALSLIVRRMFTPSSTDQIGREVNNTLISAGAEIAFNQLNNIISQSLNVNFFDLNIRSFNDASASFRLWDDRLVLTGGIADRTSFQSTDLSFFREGITTDAELTFKLRNDGSLMLRAYNRPYTRNFLIRMNDAEYISALGLVYRKEFNSINEFWRQLWSWGGIKKEDKPKKKK